MSADSSQALLSYLEEDNFGVIPSAAMTEMRFTGESINHNTESTESQELRADRQVSDLVRTAVSAGGDANIEMSYAAHDALLAGAFMDTWQAAIAKTAQEIDISAASGQTATFTDDATSGAFTAVKAGQWLRFSGFTDPLNNGYVRVEKVTSVNVIDVSGLAFVNEVDQVDIAFDNDGSLFLGTTKKHFTLEKEFPDANAGSGEFISYSGCRVSQLELNVAVGSILTGRFGFLGLAGVPAAASVGTGARVAAATKSVLNAIDNVVGIRQAGAASTVSVQSFGVTLNNNPRSQNAVGSVAAIGIGLGRALVTGTLTAYFETRTMLEEYTGFTVSDFAFRLEDAAHNVYLLDLPRMKFSQGNVVAGGIDQDVVAEMAFTAYQHPTIGHTLSLHRFDVAA
jgi:hypothetical protein